MVLAFSNGNWNEVELPSPLDKSWSQDDIFTYVSIFMKCRKNGFSDEKASQLSEAIIYKKKCVGLRYEAYIEKEIKDLLGKA